MNQPREKLEAIFEAALALESEAERQDYLSRACPDLKMRKEVESLLDAHLHPDSLFAEQETHSEARLSGQPFQETPGTVIGRYKLLQEIGHGGMGVVYMAEQQEPVRRRVALKVIKLGMDTKSVIARFEAERQALALMDHPNIARVLDGGATDTGRPYFVMELVQGLPITEFCDKNRLPVRERIKLFIPVCQAVQSAHQKGIIHRDLKPNNIMVTLNGGVPVPKVIDFGVAKATNQKLTEKTLFTQYATMIGTPAYMSPEQAEMSSLDVDTRTDIYSLGVLLYQLLTGTTPFPEKHLRSVGYQEMQRIILEEEPDRPSTRLSTLQGEQRNSVARNRGLAEFSFARAFTGDLDWITMKCLEKDRARRYETANGLAMDIQRHLDNEPVLARPPSRLYRVQKFARRNKVAFASGATVVAALLLGLSLAAAGFLQARAQRDQALAAQQLASQEKEQANKARGQALESERRAKEQELTARQRAYTSDMNLVQHAWDEGNLNRAQDLLRAYIPKVGEPDLRGFEWRYLWNLCRDNSLVKIPRAPNEPAWQLATSLNHPFVVVSGERSLRLLDPATGRELQSFSYPELDRSDTHYLVALASEAPNLLAAHRAGGVVGLWDLATKTLVMSFRPLTNKLDFLALSPDGRFLAAGEHDTLTLWDISTRPDPPRRPLWSHQLDHWVDVHVVRFSPDGQTLVANAKSFEDGTIGAWDARTGRELPAFPKRSVGYIFDLAFSPDGRLLAAAGVQSTINVWDFTNRVVKFQLPGHRGQVNSLAFSWDGNRLLSAGDDGTVRVWDIPSQKATGMFRDPDHQEVRSVVFAPRGDFIVSATANELTIWPTEPRQPATAIGTLQVWGQPVVSPDSKWLVTRGATIGPKNYNETNSAKVWDLSLGRERFHLVPGNKMPLAAAFSPNGKFFVLGGEDRNRLVGVWETALWDKANEPLHASRYLTNDFEVGSISFSPDGAIMALAGLSFGPEKPSGATNRLGFLEVGTWRKLNVLEGAGAGPTEKAAAATAAFSHNGRLLAVGYGDGWVRLWDFKRQRLLKESKEHGRDIYGVSVSFSKDDRWLASIGLGDGDVALLDVADPERAREVLAMKANEGRSWSAIFTPDNRSLVTSGNDGLIRFWNLETLKIALTLEHSLGPAVYINFSQDGKLLASQDGNGIIKLWPAPSFAEITQRELERK
jgi:WD40 repeat protein/serine/threonine protein kinase